jgi:hypothetical protein
MEIIIGSMPPLGQQAEKPQEKPGNLIGAQLLNVRPPRKGIAGPSGMERREKKVKDPLKARVITIMVPDASLLPQDIDRGQYNVYVRFVRK